MIPFPPAVNVLTYIYCLWYAYENRTKIKTIKAKKQMESNPKQRIVEKIKKSTNILVTVSRDPSVDELSAALGFTLMLNKMDKHATAVFSGATPPAITFLEPQKTFEQNTDSLRDFIIALDKEKADRLRYKVEDDVVRIYITPYQTHISEKDLDFSQGDFNVELIVALGVKKQNDLDDAISSHGRILHDATVVTINAEKDKGGLGSIEWGDEKSSSLCEMLMSLSEALQPNLLDEQIATSLLTGIVSATGRFSNDHTSPKVMTMAAQLMAAGANQQLIADELSQSDAVQQLQTDETQDEGQAENGRKLTENKSHKVNRDEKKPEKDDTDNDSESSNDDTGTPDDPEPPKKPADGSLLIDHDAKAGSSNAEAQDAIAKALSTPPNSKAPSLSVADLQNDLAHESASLDAAVMGGSSSTDSTTQDDSDTQHEAQTPAQTVSYTEPQQENVPASEQPQPAPEQPAPPAPAPQSRDDSYEPSMGGTLSATVDEAVAAKRREEMSGKNRTILSHDTSAPDQSTNAQQSRSEAEAGDHEVDRDERALTKGRDLQPITMPPIAGDPSNLTQSQNGPLNGPSIAELQAQAHQAAEPVDAKEQSLHDARSQVSSLFDTGGFEATPLPGQPAAPVPDMQSQMSQPVPEPAQQQVAQPPALPPLPPMPPMPDFSTLPQDPNTGYDQSPHPGMTPVEQQSTPQQQAQTPPATQFQIPGQ